MSVGSPVHACVCSYTCAHTHTVTSSLQHCLLLASPELRKNMVQQDGPGTPPLAAGRASGKCNGSQGMDPEGNILAEVHTGTSQESHGGSGPEGPGGRPGQLGQALGPMSACFSDSTGELLSRECHDKFCPIVSLWSLCTELVGGQQREREKPGLQEARK